MRGAPLHHLIEINTRKNITSPRDAQTNAASRLMQQWQDRYGSKGEIPVPLAHFRFTPQRRVPLCAPKRTCEACFPDANGTAPTVIAIDCSWIKSGRRAAVEDGHYCTRSRR
jgi:hypothetical protein